MSIKQALTNVAVDSFRDYLKEKLEQVKQLDLDEDGQKDLDQIGELLLQVSKKVKEAVESTNFAQLAAGFEQVVAGANLIGSSFDRTKFADAWAELDPAMQKLGELLQLGVKEMKQLDRPGS
jgi:hypothetical protein